ncbi:hypothetical protein Bca4012_004314 [Brassica carinata]
MANLMLSRYQTQGTYLRSQAGHHTLQRNVTQLEDSRLKDVMRSRKPDAHHQQKGRTPKAEAGRPSEGHMRRRSQNSEHHRRGQEDSSHPISPVKDFKEEKRKKKEIFKSSWH